VQQVIDAAQRITGASIQMVDAVRRAGDPARLVADAAKARRVLDWAPRHAELDSIIADAWRWESKTAHAAIGNQ
jgi:UDP-glucose 4-epimerase